MNRRNFLAIAAAAPAALADTQKLPLSVFTKHLQFLQGAALADAIAAIGFDGADISLRKGGHIEPSRVAQDLPPLLKALADRKVAVPMVTTDIVDVDSPDAAAVLQQLQAHGIRFYRWGGFRYDYAKPIAAQLEACKPRAAKLAELNRKYGVCALYHTHSGPNQVGASIWDIREILRDLDPAHVAINYDIGHATAEGGFGGWINSFHICGPHLRGVALKDFLWEKNKAGKWQPVWKPVGEGMVQFREFLPMLKAAHFNGPLQVHYEFPLGGAESGKREISIPKEQVFAAMKRDLIKLRAWMQEANL